MGRAGTDPDPPSFVPAYSVAKTATAAAVLRAGLPLDAPIGRLTEAPGPLAALTVGDLLAHRSGLGDYAGWPEYRAAVAAREDAWPAAEVLARAAREPLATPGAFRYSNVGYLLVRRALEEHDGAPLHDVLTARVLAPLGIDARPFVTRADWAGVAASLPVEPQLAAYDPGWVYPGTFVTDGRGLATLVRGVAAGHLGHDVMRRMSEGRAVDAPGHPLDEPGYGLGLMTSGRPARVVGHGGGGPGFTLVVLATTDGTRAHSRVEAGEVDDRPLYRACLDALQA
ncbi:beta-lactamase family protein [Actinotalea sp. M2MS4P-6]|uniref:serine hydrolase domain-containing protein n=1 Tax=Actinotalea sp. M2MS4P-6 TaxID=2983762 RepID=UPI0021E48D24|nr:serine hydrolase domain-containing protein [Actinotalea sp. M2MS4P-6]MCV2396061.1 beta-lactamase family protein [Actinotalea sp. M2MS4P-6]